MGTYTTRLGCQLSFSEEKEADIIAVIQKLNSTHKTGQFISNLIRIALESPEIIDKGSEDYTPGSLMKSMEALGISYDRKQFFQSIVKDISDMKQKIDSIYEMALKTYNLGLMGKHLSLEEKSDNNLMATFILERQLKDIQTTLGVNISDAVYASNKVLDTHEKSEQVLEYIIESYSGIINELKNQISVKQIEVPVSNTPVTIISQMPAQQVVEQPVVEQPVVEQPVDEQQDKEEEQAIDFGNDTAPPEFNPDGESAMALENFFGFN